MQSSHAAVHVMERLGEIDAVALDKTGTSPRGHPASPRSTP
ncbi:hypothetical protein [Streptomyces sp. NBC_00690]|nr:hypothetical protein [Streptomyces sp. NBC_00690]